MSKGAIWHWKVHMKKLALFSLLIFTACQTQTEMTKLDKYLAQYQPYEMYFDASGYSDRDKTVLKKLVESDEGQGAKFIIKLPKRMEVQI